MGVFKRSPVSKPTEPAVPDGAARLPETGQANEGPLSKKVESGGTVGAIVTEVAAAVVESATTAGAAVPLPTGTDCREAAMAYARIGWHVVLLRPGAKFPATVHGLLDATTDEDVIDRWFAENPDANVGVRAGAVSGLVVVDVDIKNNAGGAESLGRLEAEHGPLATLRATTPTGGQHLFFKAPDGIVVRNTAGFLPGLDSRGDGGYVVASPSTTPAGTYAWVDPAVPVAPLPGWLLGMLANRSKPAAAAGANVRPVPDTGLLAKGFEGLKAGARNDSIFRLACQLRRDGCAYDVAVAVVLGVAERCVPPIGADEATRCANNAFGYADSFPLSDVGNAERFVAINGNVARFVPEREKWIVWRDGGWRTDSDEVLHQHAKRTVRLIADEAKGLPKDSDEAKAIRRFAIASESRGKVDAMLGLASREGAVRTPERMLDADPLLLGVENGVVDLRDLSFREARPEDYITKRTGATYDPAAECPQWLGFLSQILMGSEEAVGYIQRIAGYALSGLTTERVIFFFVGLLGGNGKSTFLEVVRHVLGDYALASDAEMLMTGRGKSGGVRNDIARLAGARLVTVSESEEGARLAEANVKSLTGGDTIAVRFLFKEFFEYQPTFKIIMATNKRPQVRGTDPATWDRLHVLPFDLSIPKEQRDKGLRDRLLSEKAGILRWALEGCAEWQRGGLRPPAGVVAATVAYREEQDLLGQWLDSACTVDFDNAEIRVPASVAHKAFSVWLKEHGEEAVSRRAFGERMRVKGFAVVKSSRYHYLGLRLNDDDRL